MECFLRLKEAVNDDIMAQKKKGRLLPSAEGLVAVICEKTRMQAHKSGISDGNLKGKVKKNEIIWQERFGIGRGKAG